MRILGLILRHPTLFFMYIPSILLLTKQKVTPFPFVVVYQFVVTFSFNNNFMLPIEIVIVKHFERHIIIICI